MSDNLLRALSELLPDADFNLTSERPWHSLTFSGLQLSLKAALSGKDHSMIAGKFTRQLRKQNFDLPGWLVADIAVTEQIEEESRTRLKIDALLLDD